ncbi:glycerophosphodiester phosphodiesterase family protein [Roseivirga pacifica]|uniref:glycerophosphodiester phosphodiesterase family protein n=1 Tax=Roseivirga pacifica TaxID=1267423 RepID=UPI00227B8E0D|nr:glycerophosphodiester phosphodiesterase family protein [Roseivirga pacifica]
MRKLSLAILAGLFLFVSCNNAEKKQAETIVKAQETGFFNAATFEAEGPKAFYAWSADRIPLVSAHRGGPYPGYPENAIETFANVAEKMPAIIECDIAMTKDSVLVMMHDNTVDRTTNGTGKVAELSWAQLQELKLVDNEGTLTEFEIPTLDEVLEWGFGKVLFTLDVKRGVPFSMVVDAVEAANMEAFAAIISYNANDAKLIYDLNPDLMISVGAGSVEAYEAHKALGIPDENMLAFVGVREPEKAVYDMLHEKGITTILGVLGNLDKQAETRGDQVYAEFVKRGADAMSSDRPIEAAEAIKGLWPSESEKYKFINK